MTRYLITTTGTPAFESEYGPNIGYDDIQQYEAELTDDEAADLASDETIRRIEIIK